MVRPPEVGGGGRSAAVFQRIHPLSVVIELPRALRQLFLVILIIIIQFFTRGGLDGDAQMELWLAVLGLLVVVPGVVRYFSFGYSVHEGQLLIKSGIVTKQLRTIPLDRIQNINLTRNVLHRMLGLVDVQIETAAGTGSAEASISALSEEQAHVLKQQLAGQRPRVFSRVLTERDSREIYRPTVGELLLAGASENRALGILAGVFGLLAFQPLQEPVFDLIDGDAIRGTVQDRNSWPLLAAAFLGLFFVGWMVSIATTFVKFYGFVITKREGKIKREYGLLNHVENVLPVKRIQTVHLMQNFVQRWLGICKMFVATAGGFGSEGKQGDNVQIATAPLLTPVLRDEARGMLMELALPGRDVMSPDWRPVSPATFWRHLRSGFWPSVFVGGVSAIWVKWWGFGVFAGVLSLAALSGWVYWKTARWAEAGEVVATRTGWMKVRWNYLPLGKTQAVTVTQSPAQRWLGLATVSFASAASAFQETEIDDLSVEEARDVSMRGFRVSKETRDGLLDGF